jgi:hypothetical protein
MPWNNDPTKHICLRRWGAPIMSSESLVRNFSWNQTSISYVNSSIKLNFNQSANDNLKPWKRYVFWYVILFKIVTFLIKNLFRVRLPYLLLIRSNVTHRNDIVIKLFTNKILFWCDELRLCGLRWCICIIKLRIAIDCRVKFILWIICIWFARV